MVKNQNSLPDSVKKHFDLLDEKMFSHDKFTVKALFSGANHAKINYSAGVQTPIYMDWKSWLYFFGPETKLFTPIPKNDVIIKFWFMAATFHFSYFS